MAVNVKTLRDWLATLNSDADVAIDDGGMILEECDGSNHIEIGGYSLPGAELGDDTLSLKWGSLKAWNLKKPASLDLLKKYHDYPTSMSAIAQHDTPEQKEILCELIRQHDGTIYLDWDGKFVTKDQAIAYIMDYGKAEAK